MRTRQVAFGLLGALLSVLGPSAAYAGPEEDLSRKQRQLVESREALRTALGPEKTDAWQTARSDIEDLEP